MKAGLQVGYWTYSIVIDTEHGHLLEHVLSEAENRNSMPAGYYADALWASLSATAKKFMHRCEVAERSIYGDISFTVIGPSTELLERLLPHLQRAVENWVIKFKVNQMKGF